MRKLVLKRGRLGPRAVMQQDLNPVCQAPNTCRWHLCTMAAEAGAEAGAWLSLFHCEPSHELERQQQSKLAALWGFLLPGLCPSPISLWPQLMASSWFSALGFLSLPRHGRNCSSKVVTRVSHSAALEARGRIF